MGLVILSGHSLGGFCNIPFTMRSGWLWMRSEKKCYYYFPLTAKLYNGVVKMSTDIILKGALMLLWIYWQVNLQLLSKS